MKYIKNLKQDDLPYRVGDKLYNTHHFSPMASIKKEHGLYFPGVKPKSIDWIKLVQREVDRCINGYQVGDIKITGYHYHLLNYVNFEIHKQLDNKRATKQTDFPKFTKSHYDWLWSVEIAEKGISFDDYNNLGLSVKIRTECLEGGFHIACLKPRRAGWSEVTASMATRDFSLKDPSDDRSKNSFIVAGLEKYRNDLLDKIWRNIAYHNKETEKAFFHHRQISNTYEHKIAGVVDKQTGDPKKTGGEVVGVTLDSPRKARGISGYKIYLEEFGAFRGALKALNVMRPAVEEGGYMSGMIIAFGTGGEEGPDIEAMEDVFKSPQAHNMMVFDNSEFEDDMTHTSFFVPITRTSFRYMDIDGNPKEEEVLEEESKKREAANLSSDPNAGERYKAEFPFTPSEAFKIIGQNMFNKELLSNQLVRIGQVASLDYGNAGMNDPNSPNYNAKYQELKEFKERKGNLEWIENEKNEIKGIRFVESRDGNIVIVEPPTTYNGHIPTNLYVSGIDAIDYGVGNSSVGEKGSKLAMTVKKRMHSITADPFSNSYVAYYLDRPYDERTAFENCLKLCLYYNCDILLERTRKEIFNFFRNFRNKDYSHKFVKQPASLSLTLNLVSPKSAVGIQATPKIIHYFDNKIKEYIQDYHDKIWFTEFINQARRYDTKKRSDFDLIVAWGHTEAFDESLDLDGITVKQEDKTRTDPPVFKYETLSNGQRKLVRKQNNKYEELNLNKDNWAKHYYIDRQLNKIVEM